MVNKQCVKGTLPRYNFLSEFVSYRVYRKVNISILTQVKNIELRSNISTKNHPKNSGGFGFKRRSLLFEFFSIYLTATCGADSKKGVNMHYCKSRCCLLFVPYKRSCHLQHIENHSPQEINHRLCILYLGYNQ